MTNEKKNQSVHASWAHLRFSVVGALLAAPPPRGELQAELDRLAKKRWVHPVSGEPASFGRSTVERWYYQAKAARTDPVGVLRRKIRKDSGRLSLAEPLQRALRAQHAAHKSWSYRLHFDNLKALTEKHPELGKPPSYSTVRRWMKAVGLRKWRRLASVSTAGTRAAEARLEAREVRSYENAYVNGLWHLDFHVGSRKVLTADGEWRAPLLLGVLDDHSRLCCHLQWYLARGERAEDLVHGLAQAIQKRGLPRSLMTDNGAAMRADEVTQGLARLGVVHELTLAHSPYQNGKQESFWGQVEGRLLSMVENIPDLSLTVLNEATQAWVELEYNRKLHSEICAEPMQRFLAGKDVGRPSPSSEELRLAFCAEEVRTQRRSDGTISVEGHRFEVPSRFRHVERVRVRFAGWDLGHVHLVDERTGAVLCRLYPLDREANANGQRRSLEPSGAAIATPGDLAPAVPPLLEKLLNQYAATGLPPAYLPKDEKRNR